MSKMNLQNLQMIPKKKKNNQLSPKVKPRKLLKLLKQKAPFKGLKSAKQKAIWLLTKLQVPILYLITKNLWSWWNHLSKILEPQLPILMIIAKCSTSTSGCVNILAQPLLLRLKVSNFKQLKSFSIHFLFIYRYEWKNGRY